MPTTTEAASAAFDRLSRDIETVNRRTRTAQDSIPAADDTDFAALLDPAGVAPSPAASGIVVVPAGQPAPTDLPDGAIVVMEDPTGGTAA